MFESAVIKNCQLAIRNKNNELKQMNGATLNKEASLFLAKFAVNLREAYYDKCKENLKLAIQTTMKDMVKEDCMNYGLLLTYRDTLVSWLEEDYDSLDEETLALFYARDILIK